MPAGNVPAFASRTPRGRSSCSCFQGFSSSFFIPSPPENPPSVPAELMTRCQGMKTGMGLAPMAWPTALADPGLPIRSAIQA